MARLLPEAGAGAAPRASYARGRSAAEDGEGPFILLRDAKRTRKGPRRKINGHPPLPPERGSGILATLKGQGAASEFKEGSQGDDVKAGTR